MKRLIKKAEKQWTVVLDAEDGRYTELFGQDKDKAIQYMQEQTGKDLSNHSDTELKRIVDNWGRVIGMYYMEVSDCQICGKANKPIAARIEGFNCCSECADDYECGGWEVKDGKVVKQTYEDWLKENGLSDEDMN